MINAMFATDEANGMGFDGKLPWPHNKEDMRWFKSHTAGDVVVMGRKTWEGGMPKPLPGRLNWVVTGSTLKNDQAEVFLQKGANGVWNNSPVALVKWLNEKHRDRTIWVIGGSMLLQSMAGIFDRVYHTKITGTYECDTFLDPQAMLSGYESIYKDAREGAEFNIYAKLPRLDEKDPTRG